MKSNDAYSRLVEHGVKPSVQRLAIMDYLLTHFTHPTVDDIYKALHPIIPTLQYAQAVRGPSCGTGDFCGRPSHLLRWRHVAPRTLLLQPVRKDP